MDKPNAKYEIIHEIVSQEGNLQNISELCEIAGVSRSGYYYWLHSSDKRSEKEARDQADFELILQAYQFRGYDKGIRGIHMRLLHMNPPVIMNTKKIQRLMHKYRLVCPIRKANPYRRMAKAIKTDAIADNLLQRQFKEYGPRKVLLTDITYIPCCGVFFYLSVIKDAYTMQILAYVLSESLELDFVLETVNILIESHGATLDDETLIHSDQGCHYTSNAFIRKLKDASFVQSMSRKGNCWDNAPQESFFGHMKDEIAALIAGCDTYEQVQAVVADWMDYYNKDRYQWDLEKLSPREYYCYRQTGVYPLKPGISKKRNSQGSAPDPEV